MKRVLLACVGIVALSGAAAAADLPVAPAPYYKAPVYAPAYNWSGFYLGINGGGGWGRSTWTTTGPFDTSGGLVGGTLGYNYQVNQVVLGVEGDIDWANINGSTNTGCTAVGGTGCATGDNWLSTVRGRLGYAADRFMPYITGGAAFGDIKASGPGSPALTRPTPAGRSAAASNSPSPVTGPPRPNISTSTSAASRAASPAARRCRTSTGTPISAASV